MIPLTRPPNSTTKIAMSEIVQAVAEASGGMRSGVYKSAPPTGQEGASLPTARPPVHARGVSGPEGESLTDHDAVERHAQSAKRNRNARGRATQRQVPPSLRPLTRVQRNPPGVRKDRLIDPRYRAISRAACPQRMLRAEVTTTFGDAADRQSRTAAAAMCEPAAARVATRHELRIAAHRRITGDPIGHAAPKRAAQAPPARACSVDGRSIGALRPHVSDTTRRWGDTGPVSSQAWSRAGRGERAGERAGPLRVRRGAGVSS